MISNNKLSIICLVGGFLEAIDMKKAKETYGEHVKSIKPNEIQMWSN